MRKSEPLDRNRIVGAAVALLDEVGLAGLSTRRLATALGVQSATLYWHVRNKDELLDLVAEALCADAFTIDPALPWPDQLASGLFEAQWREEHSRGGGEFRGGLAPQFNLFQDQVCSRGRKLSPQLRSCRQ